MDGKMAKLEVIIRDMREKLKIIESCIEELDFTLEELKEGMQGVLNSVTNILTQKNDALKAMIEAMKK